MKLRPVSCIVGTLAKLRSWLRGWLKRPVEEARQRLEELGWRRDRRLGRPRLRPFVPDCEVLEDRRPPNDPFGLPVRALAHLGLQEAASTVAVRPAQVL